MARLLLQVSRIEPAQKKMLRASETARIGPEALGARKASQTPSRCGNTSSGRNVTMLIGTSLRRPVCASPAHRTLARIGACETRMDEVAYPRTDSVRVERCDFDADGAEELLVQSPRMAALLRPARGGTLKLDFRPTAVTLINSMQRHRAYHDRLREASHGHPHRVASIHDNVRSLEEGLERFLSMTAGQEIRFDCSCFHPQKALRTTRRFALDENAALAGVLTPCVPLERGAWTSLARPRSTARDGRATRRGFAA